MTGHYTTDTAKNHSAFDIPFGTIVALDRGPLAQRWPHLGTPVRRPAPSETIKDVVGVALDPLSRLDPERPGASGSGGVAVSGLAWVRCCGPVTGTASFPMDTSAYASLASGDELGLILSGPHAGACRRVQAGDIRIGAALVVEEDFCLVRLALGGRGPA